MSVPRRRRAATSAPTAPSTVPSVEARLVAVELAPVLAVQAVWRTTPAIRSGPLAIATPGGPIQAVCPRAAESGVVPGQSLAQARLRCPDLRLAPPDRAVAGVLWDELLAALGDISPRIEAADPEAGVAYLDARGLAGVWGDAAAVAQAALRALDGLGLAARAGAGPTRVVALALARRMDSARPRLLTDSGARAFLHALSIDDPALGLAPAVTTRLRELGIRTVGAFAALPPAGLGLRFGPATLATWRRVTCGEELPLRPYRAPETLQAGRLLDGGLADAVLLERLIGVLSADLADRLAARGAATALLTVDLLCDDDARRIMDTRCWPPVCTATALRATALALLARLRLSAPVVSVRLQAGELRRPQAQQDGLWPGRPRQRRRERLAAVLAAEVRRHERLQLRRLRPDPVSEEGWRTEDLEPEG